MFKKIRANLAKRKINKKAKDAKITYVIGHILITLSNSLNAMKSINDKQKEDLYQLYATTLWECMTSDNRLLFTNALSETNEALSQLSKNVPNSQVQIKRQLQDIFKTQHK